MKRLMWLTALGTGLALAGCDEPVGQDAELAPASLEAELAPAAADQTAPAADTGAAIDPRPADGTALPPEQRPSGQTVQPESETLFY
jgi:hypothetical protein